MLASVLYVVLQRVLQLLVFLFRSPKSKDLEIVVLRHQLAVLRRQVRRPTVSGGRPIVPHGGQSADAARQLIERLQKVLGREPERFALSEIGQTVLIEP